jgi:undecaprenyl-diphosphatase
MKVSTDDRRLWVETAVLAGLSALLALLMNKYFARYGPPKSVPNDRSGDAPIATWNKPKPEEKANAEPVRRTLDRATAQVDSPEKADRVVERLEELAGNATTGEVEQAKPLEKPTAQVSEKVAESSRRVEQAAKSAPPGEKAAEGIAQAAKEITASPSREKAALADATEEALNPEQKGAPSAKNPSQRKYLREAVLKRMKPFDALDARLFLVVNRLPRNRWLNGFFSFFTLTFRAGMGWYVMMAMAILVNRRRGIRAVRDTILPLSVASSLVEFPIKTFIRRRRPFIAYIQAIVIGKKPGTWSFPSGHSASAFAGASLLSRDFPEQRLLLFLVAALVAFSRIYLGDHYPGDVVSGALSGITFADTMRRAQGVMVRDSGQDLVNLFRNPG